MKTKSGGAKEKEHIPIGWKSESEIRTRSVLFVRVTPKGRLAKLLRDVEERLRGITGYRTKILEGVGRKLKDMFSNADPWAGQPCGRQDCIPCQQEGDTKQNCRKKMIYMNQNVKYVTQGM